MACFGEAVNDGQNSGIVLGVGEVSDKVNGNMRPWALRNWQGL